MKQRIIIAFTALCWALPVGAADTLYWHTLSGGHGVQTQDTVRLRGVAGQCAAGTMRDAAGGDTELTIGFFGNPYVMTWLAKTAPDVPTGLTVTGVSDGQVMLAWDAGEETDIAYHVIYRSLTSGFGPDATDSVGQASGGTVYTDANGLTDGVPYYYRIAAVNNAGQKSDFSAQAAATPGVGPVTDNIQVSPDPTRNAIIVTLTADAADTATGGSNIAGAEYFIDALGQPGTGQALNVAEDGSFDETVETVTNAGVSVVGWAVGYHTVYVRSKDARGNWGDADSTQFIVSLTPPVLTSMTPDVGFNIEPLNVVVKGTGFQDGAMLQLVRDGSPMIDGMGPVLEDSITISCQFELGGADAGVWNLVIVNPDFETDTLAGAVTVNPEPSLTGLTPREGTIAENAAAVTLSGANFKDCFATLIRSGYASTDADSIALTSDVQITAWFDLTGAATGTWGITVTNFDGQADTLADTFSVVLPAPVIDSVVPSAGADTGSVAVTTLGGNYFYNGAAVSLCRDSVSISASAVNVASVNLITCSFDLEDAAVGAWDLVVVNSGGRADTLAGGFTVNNVKPPAVPAGLYAAAGNGKVSLSWSENAEADMAEYIVYRGTTTDSTAAGSVAVTMHPTVTYSDEGLTNGVTYYYWIAARDTASNTGFKSASAEATPSLPSIYTDSVALADMYDSTAGAFWDTNTAWLSGTVDTWHGISVSSGRVIDITLPDNNLDGKLLQSIANIEYLRTLYVSGNALTGNIPVNIGDLDSLHALILHDNGFIGAIPAGITGLEALEYLTLHGNSLTGAIPAAIGSLDNLVLFTADSNALSGTIPDGIGNMSSLNHLSLSGNGLTGNLPSALGSAAALGTLNVAGNNLTGEVPDIFGSLAALRIMDLSGNDFSGLPDLSGTGITSLEAGGNALTFEDIEPNIGIASFGYTPQDSVGTARDTVVQAGTDLVLDVSVGGSSNRYQWSRDGSTLSAAAASSSYTLSAISSADSGVYTCDVTNTLATGLTISNRPLRVRVDAAPAVPVGLSVTAGDGQAELNWGANAETDFLMYRIYMGTVSAGETLRDSTAAYSKNSTSATITDITVEGVYYFTVTAMDTNRFESAWSAEVSAFIGNYAPVFSTTADALNDTIDEDVPYTAVVAATDLNAADTVAYGLIAPYPSGMTVDAAAGTLAWTPGNGQVGDNTVTVTAADPAGLADTLIYSLHVLNVNDAPQITSAAADTATEDVVFTYTAAAADPDNTPVITFAGVPGWLQTAGDTLRGSAPEGAGDTVFTVIASDGELADTLVVSLAVLPVNDPPQIVSPSVGLAIALEEFEYIIEADDPDDTPVLSIVYMPSWLSAAGTDTLRGTPAQDTPDTSFMIVASDGEYADTQVVTVTVQDSNSAPVIISDSTAQAIEDSLFRYVAAASDAEGNPLQLTFPVLPSWLTASGDTVSGTPLEGAGDTVFTVVATDGKMNDTLAVALSVQAVNDPPVITSAAADTATEDIPFVYITRASDPESDPAVGFVGLPSWLTAAGDTLTGTPGEGTADTFVTIFAYDGALYDTLVLSLTVLAVNDTPVITSAASDTALTGTPYTYIGTAADPDDIPVVTYEQVPGWLTAAGDTLSGTPLAGYDDTSFVMIASDGELADTLVVGIDVQTVSFDTLRITSPARDTAIEGSLYVYTATGTSPNPPVTLSFYAASWPAWLDTSGQTVQGTPPAGASDASFFVIARDNAGATKMMTVDVVVAPPNIAPVITSPSVVEAREGVTFTYTAAAVDSNPGDVITFTFSGFPVWLDTTANILSGVPPAGSKLTFLEFTVVASDGRLSDSLDISTLIFPPVNLAPYLVSAAADTGREGMVYTYRAAATDPNAADTLTYIFMDLPGWLTFDGDSTASGLPPQGSGGTDTVFGVTVTDQGDSTDTITVTLHIRAPLNVAPIITSASRDTVREGDAYLYTPAAVDSNYDDTVAVRISGYPAGLDTAGGVLSGTLTGLEADTVFYFTVSAADLDGAADTLICTLVAVNNAAPAVIIDSVSAAVPDTAGGDITVGYTLTDTEYDTLSLHCYYYDDVLTAWQPATVSGATTGLDSSRYEGSVTWHCGTDIPGQVFSRVSRFMIVPADRGNVSGTADSTGLFTVFNLLGDFNADGTLGFTDLDSFAFGWRTQAAGMDIGPASGIFPSLVPQPDSVIDAQDLNIFLLMFNWAVSAGYTSFNPPALKPVAPAALHLTAENDGSRLLRVSGITDPVTVRIWLRYDPALVAVSGARAGSALADGTAPLQMAHTDAGAGYSAWYGAVLEGTCTRSGGEYEMFSFTVEKGGAEPVEVQYEIRGTSGQVIAAGVSEFLLSGSPVGALPVTGVFPNPSIAGVSLYCAAPASGTIRFTVYDPDGSVVYTREGFKQEGRAARVGWDGRDVNGTRTGAGLFTYEVELNGKRWSGTLIRE